MEPFCGLDSLLGEYPTNPSDASPDSSNDIPIEDALLGASLEGINSGSLRRLLDVSNDDPPWGAFLGASLEESGCGADSWGLFEACLKLAPQEL